MNTGVIILGSGTRIVARHVVSYSLESGIPEGGRSYDRRYWIEFLMNCPSSIPGEPVKFMYCLPEKQDAGKVLTMLDQWFVDGGVQALALAQVY